MRPQSVTSPGRDLGRRGFGLPADQVGALLRLRRHDIGVEGIRPNVAVEAEPLGIWLHATHRERCPAARQTGALTYTVGRQGPLQFARASSGISISVMQLEPVPTAYVGLGGRGMRYLRASHWVGGFTPVALVDTDAERFGEARKFTELPELACHASLAAALQAHEIAAVFVCAPASAHAPIILEAVTAGAHVFTETPFTTKYADAAEAVKIAAVKGLAIVVAQQYRLAAVERTITKLLAQGALGGVGFGYLRHDLPAREPAAEDGTSRLWRADVHTIDSIIAMMPGGPTRVFGRLFSPGFSDAAAPSSVQATLEFDDGSVVQYLSSFESHQPGYRFRIDCEAATLVHRAAHPGRGDDAAELIQIAPDGSRQPVTLDTSYDDAWLEETLAIFFKDYFRLGKEPATSGRNNLATMAVLQALLRSSETGQAIDVADVAPEVIRERG